MDREYQGYVAQAEVDAHGNMRDRFVPWYEADALGEVGVLTGPDANRLQQETVRVPAFSKPEPIQKQSNEARLNEMTAILVKQYQEWGFLPESILRDIQSLYWISGQPTSVDELRQVAGEYLRMAEAESRRK